MKIYAYARVSARDQNLDRQLKAFADFGVSGNRIYADKKSGKDFERKNYSKLLKRLRAGDLLVIKSIDRLGRNYNAIISEWSKIVNTIGADILVLDMPLLDTRTKSNTLVGKFISDIVLQVLSFVAENERENIPRKTSGGNRRRKKPRRAVRQAADGLLERISGNGACFQTEKHFFENCPRLHGHETGKFLLSPAPMRAA